MDFSPPRHEDVLVFNDHLQRPPDVPPFHSERPDQLGAAIGAEKIYLGLTGAKHMDVGGFVIVQEDHDIQSVSS
jgi:hypothetical protein